MPKLQEAIKEETEAREESSNALMKSSNDEIQKLSTMITGEKKSREETEEAMLEMLKDMVRLHGDYLEAEFLCENV